MSYDLITLLSNLNVEVKTQPTAQIRFDTTDLTQAIGYVIEAASEHFLELERSSDFVHAKLTRLSTSPRAVAAREQRMKLLQQNKYFPIDLGNYGWEWYFNYKKHYRGYVAEHPGTWPLYVNSIDEIKPYQNLKVAHAKVVKGLDPYPEVTAELILELARRIDREFLGNKLCNIGITFGTQKDTSAVLRFAAMGEGADIMLGSFHSERMVIQIRPDKFNHITLENGHLLPCKNGKIVRNRNRLDAVIETLQHEMVHVLLEISQDFDRKLEDYHALRAESKVHGDVFVRTMKGIFGSYTITTDLDLPSSHVLKRLQGYHAMGPQDAHAGLKILYYSRNNEEVYTGVVLEADEERVKAQIKLPGGGTHTLEGDYWLKIFVRD